MGERAPHRARGEHADEREPEREIDTELDLPERGDGIG